METLEELIKKAKRKDIKAYTKIFQNIEKDLYRIAYTKLKSTEDINDAIQNTMIIIFKNIKQLKEDCYFKTWVIKILINECNKIIKDNIRRDKIFEKSKDNIIFKNPDNNKDFEEFLNFNNIISSLSPDEQLIFNLYYKDKFSCKEIADITKINENTIKSKLDRGRKKIKLYFEKEEL